MNEYHEPRSASPLAIGLGCFSVGLGLAEVLAPHALARLIGAEEDDDTAAQLRTLGAREIGTGLAILAQPAQPAWLWSRVGGDALDLAWLGNTASDRRTDRTRLATAAAAVLGVTALDVLCAQQLSRERANGGDVSPRVRVHRQVTIRRPVEDVYALLAPLREPAALHAPPRRGEGPGQRPFTLDGHRSRRCARHLGSRHRARASPTS